jgi:hypothetical protein
MLFTIIKCNKNITLKIVQNFVFKTVSVKEIKILTSDILISLLITYGYPTCNKPYELYYFRNQDI